MTWQNTCEECGADCVGARPPGKSRCVRCSNAAGYKRQLLKAKARIAELEKELESQKNETDRYRRDFRRLCKNWDKAATAIHKTLREFVK